MADYDMRMKDLINAVMLRNGCRKKGHEVGHTFDVDSLEDRFWHCSVPNAKADRVARASFDYVRPYTKDAYLQLVTGIVTHMVRRAHVG